MQIFVVWTLAGIAYGMVELIRRVLFVFQLVPSSESANDSTPQARRHCWKGYRKASSHGCHCRE
jgi:hypothetical protein